MRTLTIPLRDLRPGAHITCAKAGLFREARVYGVTPKGPARVEVATTAGRFNLPGASLVTVHCRY